MFANKKRDSKRILHETPEFAVLYLMFPVMEKDTWGISVCLWYLLIENLNKT